MISLIAATGKNRVIGKDNKLIWHLPEDLKFFKKMTTDKIIVMGRKTYESLGRPLPNRINVVLTRDENYSDPYDSHVTIFKSSVQEFIDWYNDQHDEMQDVFVIGGAEIYNQFLPYIDTIYLTKINHDFEGDAFFPEFNDKEWEIVSWEKGKKDEKNIYDYAFTKYRRRK